MNIFEIFEKYRQSCKKKEYKIDGYSLFIDEEYQINEISIILNLVGKGSYGIVLSGKKGDIPVAIKKIENVFENKKTAIRCLRELIITRLLQHDNVIEYNNR